MGYCWLNLFWYRVRGFGIRVARVVLRGWCRVGGGGENEQGPRLIVYDVPVERVELVEGHCLQRHENRWEGQEVARRVQQQAPPRVARPVGHLQARVCGAVGHGHAPPAPDKELRKGLQAPQRAPLRVCGEHRNGVVSPAVGHSERVVFAHAQRKRRGGEHAHSERRHRGRAARQGRGRARKKEVPCVAVKPRGQNFRAERRRVAGDGEEWGQARSAGRARRVRPLLGQGPHRQRWQRGVAIGGCVVGGPPPVAGRGGRRAGVCRHGGE